MNSSARGFDGLARIYRTLEFLAFGRDLERARFVALTHLRECQDILVLGEGDGRALVRLLAVAPAARIHCVDASAVMLAHAERRISPSDRGRVTFQHADVLTVDFPIRQFDAVTTVFFLDCFTANQVTQLTACINAALRPNARWLFVDFSLPIRGYARFRARVWLRLLYAFFRWRTQLSACELPPSEQIITASGWTKQTEYEFQDGLVRSVVFNQPGSRT